MQLYERIISPAGKVTYREHVPKKPNLIGDQLIEESEVVSLLTALVVSMQMSISEQLASHTKFSRELKLFEAAVVRFAALNQEPLTPELVDVGVTCWNAAVKTMQDGLARVRQ
jgi:hypothetical protein